jgi:FAD dependent oxidoreductase
LLLSVVGLQVHTTHQFETLVVHKGERFTCHILFTTACISGLATAYHLVRGGAAVTVFDEQPVGQGGASAVAAGMLHPLTPRGKLIWKGAEGLAAANQLIEVNEWLQCFHNL